MRKTFVEIKVSVSWVKMNPDAYETLPTTSIKIHMMAGACAGIMEHCVMYSVDSVKVNITFKSKQ